MNTPISKKIQEFIDGGIEVDFIQIDDKKLKIEESWDSYITISIEDLEDFLHVNEFYNSQVFNCLSEIIKEDNPRFILFEDIIDIQDNVFIINSDSFHKRISYFEEELEEFSNEVWRDLEDYQRQEFSREDYERQEFSREDY